MHWNKITSTEFKDAVHECEGVFLFSIGCLEQHGDHLPLGIDYMKGWHFTDLAAKKEKAVVQRPIRLCKEVVERESIKSGDGVKVINARTFEVEADSMEKALKLM